MVYPSPEMQRDPDAPAMVHFLDEEFEPEAFNTLRDAIRFLTTKVRPAQRGRAWIATQGVEVRMDEIVHPCRGTRHQMGYVALIL